MNKILSQSEVIAMFGIPRQTFEQGIRPLMEQRGEARNLGGGKRASWAYSSEYIWQWKLYLATRQNLIAAGVWSEKRPHNMQDVDDIVSGGLYEGHQPE